MCIFLVFPYIVSVFATGSVLAIRRASLLRNFHLGCSAALMSPLGAVSVCCCLWVGSLVGLFAFVLAHMASVVAGRWVIILCSFEFFP